VGTIANSAWQTTKINLRPASRRFIVNTSSGPAIGIASPGGLVSGGAGFKVLYQQLLVPGGNIFGIRAGTARAGHIVHPTR
jgi:hypothetical protein